jgi:hypothetical protein
MFAVSIAPNSALNLALSLMQLRKLASLKGTKLRAF